MKKKMPLIILLILRILILFGEDRGLANLEVEKLDVIEYDLGNEEAEAMMALIFHIQNEKIVKIEILSGN